MIERLQWMIARGSADLHSGSLTAYKSRILGEELIRITDPKVVTQYVVRIIHIFPIKYVPGKKQQPKGGRPHEARREEPATARAGVADELSTSQERAYSADEDTGCPELSKPFTNEQDKQIAAFFGHHPCFYDMSHPNYKNKKRSGFILQFAQSMFTSGKCVLSFIFNVETIVYL